MAFGGLTPSEAAKRRWDRKRAQEQDSDQARAEDARRDVALVRVTVETGAVIDRLAQDAKKGNTQAARELREWLARVEVETDTSVSALDRATRQRMKARLLSELREEREAQGAAPMSHVPMPIAVAVARAADQGAQIHAQSTVGSGAVGQVVQDVSLNHAPLREPSASQQTPDPAERGTPVVASPGGSTDARDTTTGNSEEAT